MTMKGLSMSKLKRIPIIIPTYNNLEFILPCIYSIAENTAECYDLVVINNGAEELKNSLQGVNIVYTGQNLGWMGGINKGLEHIKDMDYDYVLLLNDDTHILPKDFDWLAKLKAVLENDPKVAAVGPSSNVVAGSQNMRHKNLPALVEVPFLIGFCVLMRRSALEEIGGLDESLPGGDDFDWSIEFRKRGYKLVARRDSFVYHHGFVTGNKVHGDSTARKGWNSPQMTEDTNFAIIRKHGFKAWLKTIRDKPIPYEASAEEYTDENCLMKIVEGKGIDVGCGSNKISKDAIGVDMILGGDIGGKFGGPSEVSQADVKASGDNLFMFEDGELDYVVARHNIEHYANPLRTLREWFRVLKEGGRVGITTPDDTRLSAIRLDPTHKHSFNRECMKDMLELVGFNVIELSGCANQWNFFVIAEKPSTVHYLVEDDVVMAQSQVN